MTNKTFVYLIYLPNNNMHCIGVEQTPVLHIAAIGRVWADEPQTLHVVEIDKRDMVAGYHPIEQRLHKQFDAHRVVDLPVRTGSTRMFRLLDTDVQNFPDIVEKSMGVVKNMERTKKNEERNKKRAKARRRIKRREKRAKTREERQALYQEIKINQQQQ